MYLTMIVHNISRVGAFKRSINLFHYSTSHNLPQMVLGTKIKKGILSTTVNTDHQSTRHNSSVSHNLDAKDKKVCVYAGPLKRRIKFVKVLSLTSSACGLGLLPFMIHDISEISMAMASVTALMSVAFLSSPLILNWITKRYVIELLFNNETKLFTAKRYDLFNRVQEIKFTADDVIIPDVPGILTSILVRNNALFVDSTLIENVSAYSHMMGYDKPFDFSVGIDVTKDDTKRV